MPVPPRRPVELRGRVFRGSAVVAAGQLTPRELRSSAWRRLFRDVYACADLPVTHELRTVAAAWLLLPDAVVTGLSAAVLWGLPAAAAEDPVELTVPARSPACTVPGLRVRRRTLAPAHVTTRRGARVTTPAATAVDLGRFRPFEEAVALVDRLVGTGVTDLAEVRTAATGARGPGCRDARAVAAATDGLAESPQETRLRLLLHRSGLPLPVAQYSVRTAGRFVARVDFAWPEHRLAVEYDGLWHRAAHQFIADRQRLNRLSAAGWRVLFVTAQDLQNPERLLARIAAELSR